MMAGSAMRLPEFSLSAASLTPAIAALLPNYPNLLDSEAWIP